MKKLLRAKVRIEPSGEWFPDALSIHGVRNPNYLNSLFIGLTAPIINLPMLLWNMVLKHVVVGTFLLLSFFWLTLLRGLSGNATAAKAVTIIDDGDDSPPPAPPAPAA